MKAKSVEQIHEHLVLNGEEVWGFEFIHNLGFEGEVLITDVQFSTSHPSGMVVHTWVRIPDGYELVDQEVIDFGEMYAAMDNESQ